MATHSQVLACLIVVIHVVYSTVVLRIVTLHRFVLIQEYLQYEDILHIVSLIVMYRI